MKSIHRSKRLDLLRRKDPFNSQDFISDEDESDGDHRNLTKTKRNANRTATTTLIETQANQSTLLPVSSDQSSLYLYSINSIAKATSLSNDLTPLTSSSTPLTPLTSTHTKQTEATTVQIDLTLLSSTDTLASSSITSHQELPQHLSLKHHIPSIDLSQTDTSMKSIIFDKANPVESEILSYRKNTSLPTITDIAEHGDSSMTPTINIDLSRSQRTPIRWSPTRWNFHSMSNRVKLFIGCSSIGFIAGVILLMMIL